MVPGTVTTHEIPLTRALHIRKRSKCRVVGETEELMEEGNIVRLRDFLRGVRLTAADCRPRAAHLTPHQRGKGRGVSVMTCLLLQTILQGTYFFVLSSRRHTSTRRPVGTTHKKYTRKDRDREAGERPCSRCELQRRSLHVTQHSAPLVHASRRAGGGRAHGALQHGLGDLGGRLPSGCGRVGQVKLCAHNAEPLSQRARCLAHEPALSAAPWLNIALFLRPPRDRIYGSCTCSAMT
jgi:hypothetical protein